MGFRIALYSWTLFSKESCERLPIKTIMKLKNRRPGPKGAMEPVKKYVFKDAAA
jgi:hypothetical protein